MGLLSLRPCTRSLLLALTLLGFILCTACATTVAAPPQSSRTVSSTRSNRVLGFIGEHCLPALATLRQELVASTATEKDELVDLYYCSSVAEGTISGKAVVVVTTQKGSVSALLCTQQFLRAVGWRLEALVHVGEAAVSPVVGGWDPLRRPRHNLAPEDREDREEEEEETERREGSSGADGEKDYVLLDALADKLITAEAWRDRVVSKTQREHADRPHAEESVPETATAKTDGCAPYADAPVVALGSLCVSSAALSMAGDTCTEELAASQCGTLRCSRGSLLREARASVQLRNASLTQALRSAVADMLPTLPPVPAAVREGMRAFFAAHEAWAGGEGALEEGSSPRLLPCAELSTEGGVRGARFDAYCRERTTAAAPQSPEPAACVSGRAALGFLRAVEHSGVPATVLRVGARYTMFPQKRRFLSEGGADKAERRYVWEQDPAYLPADVRRTFEAEASKYGSDVLLHVIRRYFFASSSPSSSSPHAKGEKTA